jgi:hypothetical protein
VIFAMVYQPIGRNGFPSFENKLGDVTHRHAALTPNSMSQI